MNLICRTYLLLLFLGFSAPLLARPAESAEAVAAAAATILAEAVPEPDGPGFAILVKAGEAVLYRGARGRASVELDVALTPDNVFRIGSVTKQFAAAGLLKLVDEGKVSLDDSLAKFLSDYPNGEAISVLQLLNHTSGIKSYTGIPGYMQEGVRRDLATAELVAVFADEAPDFPPGESWAYNNSGYVLVGAVIEAASGQPWGAWLEESLFEPLGLEDTRDGATDEVIPKHAEGYSLRPDGSFRVAGALSMTQPHAAGALVSTVDDLVRWNEALHRGAVLSQESYTRMTTPEGAALEPGYGFGIGATTVRGRPALEHGGGIFGFVSSLLYVPEAELSVAVLRNADGPGLSPTLVARRLGAVALGDPYPAPTPIDVPPGALEAVQGVYRQDAENARIVRVVDGRLTSQRTGGGRFDLVPIAEDTFLFEGSLSYFTIERDAAGKPTAMRFFAEGEGEGEVWPRTDEPLAQREALELSREAMARLVGEYESEALAMSVFLDDDGALRVQIPGQPAFQLYAESPTRLYITEVDATFDFSPGEGEAKTVLLNQGPARIELARVDR